MTAKIDAEVYALSEEDQEAYTAAVLALDRMVDLVSSSPSHLEFKFYDSVDVVTARDILRFNVSPEELALTLRAGWGVDLDPATEHFLANFLTGRPTITPELEGGTDGATADER